jgi:hypothetical protein
MTTKHTPGPWASNKYTTSVSVPLKAIDCERIGFSIVFVNGHREKEAAANARLIAAAPDLLEALKEMLEVWEEDPAYGHASAEKARAAIKAVEEA